MSITERIAQKHDEMQRELEAMRKRKGPGVELFKHQHAVMQFIYRRHEAGDASAKQLLEILKT